MQNNKCVSKTQNRHTGVQLKSGPLCNTVAPFLPRFYASAAYAVMQL